MSFYNITDTYYQPPSPGTPGWQLAPVPGWGMNPARSGPAWIAANGVGGGVQIRSIVADYAPVNSLGDSEEAGNQGKIALGVAGGIFLGWALAWVYWSNKSPQRRK